jgi:uncharacterized protein YcbX
VIETDGEAGSSQGHPEFNWTGRSARIGSTVIDFDALCPRCVMVTREVDESVPADRAVLRYIVRELEQNVGVYATIKTPGTIQVGDALEFI